MKIQEAIPRAFQKENFETHDDIYADAQKNDFAVVTKQDQPPPGYRKLLVSELVDLAKKSLSDCSEEQKIVYGNAFTYMGNRTVNKGCLKWLCRLLERLLNLLKCIGCVTAQERALAFGKSMPAAPAAVTGGGSSTPPTDAPNTANDDRTKVSPIDTAIEPAVDGQQPVTTAPSSSTSRPPTPSISKPSTPKPPSPKHMRGVTHLVSEHDSFSFAMLPEGTSPEVPAPTVGRKSVMGALPIPAKSYHFGTGHYVTAPPSPAGSGQASFPPTPPTPTSSASAASQDGKIDGDQTVQEIDQQEVMEKLVAREKERSAKALPLKECTIKNDGSEYHYVNIDLPIRKEFTFSRKESDEIIALGKPSVIYGHLYGLVRWKGEIGKQFADFIGSHFQEYLVYELLTSHDQVEESSFSEIMNKLMSEDEPNPDEEPGPSFAKEVQEGRLSFILSYVGRNNKLHSITVGEFRGNLLKLNEGYKASSMTVEGSETFSFSTHSLGKGDVIIQASSDWWKNKPMMGLSNTVRLQREVELQKLIEELNKMNQQKPDPSKGLSYSIIKIG